ncbi:hypothetical protein R6Q59_016440 [Mikania micrantha]
MNNWMNTHHRVEDKELDDLWKTMSRWLEAGLLQSLWHSDSVHSFRILTPINSDRLVGMSERKKKHLNQGLNDSDVKTSLNGEWREKKGSLSSFPFETLFSFFPLSRRLPQPTYIPSPPSNHLLPVASFTSVRRTCRIPPSRLRHLLLQSPPPSPPFVAPVVYHRLCRLLLQPPASFTCCYIRRLLRVFCRTCRIPIFVF